MSLFGEPLPKHITSKHSGISPKLREELFADYIDRKANEKKTDVLKATVSAALAGGLAGHVIKKKITEVANSKATGVMSRAQKAALNFIGTIAPGVKKSRVIALLAGVGAVYGFNRAMTSAMEQDRAKKIQGDKAKIRRELAIRLSES
jgi:hypothetical protein